MQIQYDVTGSIVLYRNDPSQVKEAIRCFFGSPLAGALVVIDNSPDESLRSVVEAEGAEYIFTAGNVGFGAAHNIGIRKYIDISHYHLILNPDTSFDPSTISSLCSFLHEKPNVGLVMPKILYPDMSEQRLCKRLPTPCDLLLRRFIGGVAWSPIRRRMAKYTLDDIDLTNPRFIPNLSGCFMFVRVVALKSVGFFDERYFLYLEDVDLCRRIAEKWDTYYYPHAQIIHEYGNGSYRDLHHLKLHMVSAWKYFNKWGWVFDRKRSELNKRIGA
jgi:GT2 family glycosyltransferase